MPDEIVIPPGDEGDEILAAIIPQLHAQAREERAKRRQ